MGCYSTFHQRVCLYLCFACAWNFQLQSVVVVALVCSLLLLLVLLALLTFPKWGGWCEEGRAGAVWRVTGAM